MRTERLTIEGAERRMNEYFEAQSQINKRTMPIEDLMTLSPKRDKIIDKMILEIPKLQSRLEKLFNLVDGEREATMLAFDIKLLHEHREILRLHRNDFFCCETFVLIVMISQALKMVYGDINVE